MTIDTEEDFVSFTEEGDETAVQIGKEDKPTSSSNDERLAKAEAEQAELRGHLNNLYGNLNNNQPRQQQPDHYAAELERVANEERAMGIEFEALRASNSLNKSTIDKFDKQARDLQQRRIDISTQRTIQNVIPQLVNAQQTNQFRQQYSDVHNNEKALQYAHARYNMLLSKGEADSPQLVDRAMNDARVEFRMSGVSKSGPTDQDKRQLSGVGGGGGRNGGSSNVVKMGKAEKSMAMALYGQTVNGDEKKAWAMWAKGPGLKAKKAAERVKR